MELELSVMFRSAELKIKRKIINVASFLFSVHNTVSSDADRSVGAHSFSRCFWFWMLNIGIMWFSSRVKLH